VRSLRVRQRRMAPSKTARGGGGGTGRGVGRNGRARGDGAVSAAGWPAGFREFQRAAAGWPAGFRELRRAAARAAAARVAALGGSCFFTDRGG
jgi:hypothetical protein